jgi:pyruvate formate lyase activating enzyme
MANPLYSITPFTLLDYPDKTACILWFAGCNMRCLYCYNPDIVNGKGKISFQQALDFLDKRGSLLDGVVLSGGECTLHKGLPDFICKLKQRGYSVKIDTNGSTPLLLEKLIQTRQVDYIALDFKALPHTFKKITVSDLYKNFEQSLKILLRHNMNFEVRTTVHSDLIDKDDMTRMIEFLETLGYTGNYYIQHFVNNTPTLGDLEMSRKILTAEDFNASGIPVIFRV